MPTWPQAFAEQAKSDLEAFDFIARSNLPTCHRLHYLQMWLEKLCKAYLWLPGVGSEELRGRHAVVGKVLPRMVREHWRRIGFEKRPDITAIQEICRDIDLLHPQVDDNRRSLDNVEYPWPSDSGNIEIPSQWKFDLSSRLYTDSGRLLLKAARSLTQSPAIFIR
ncbi:MAG: hypothetical protein H6752_01420 [Candidatus Omnitrophica bacterium]|nr:hypothetical protein [Candidatus Omnitrophota bacterium]